MNSIICKGLLSGMLAFLILGAPAAAQFTNAEEGDTAELLDEIVTTARRRGENLQQTPLSVAVISATDLENRSIRSFDQLSQYVPNISINDNGFAGAASADVQIRGIGQTDWVITKDPGVGTYVDGVYIGRSQGLMAPLLDIQAVEVLRGPQGTLYGKNTIGGAIKMTTKKPHGEFVGQLAATIAEDGRQDFKGTVNIPLVDGSLYAKFSALSASYDGYGSTRIDDGFGGTLEGHRRGDEEITAGRLQFLLAASDSVEVNLSIDAFENNGHQSAGGVISVDADATHPLLGIFFDPGLTIGEAYAMLGRTYDSSIITNDPFTSTATGPQELSFDGWGSSLTISWDLRAFTLTSITSYRELDSVISVDSDESPFDLFEQNEDNTQDQFSQEFNFSGTAADGRLDWTAGLYYYEETAERFIQGHIFGDFWRGGLFPSVIETGVANTIGAKTESLAAYGQVSYDLSDQLSATFGLRWSDEEKSASGIQRTFFTRTNIGIGTASDSWTDVAPRIGLEYQVNDAVMAYISAAKGFKSGGFNSRLNPAAENGGLISYDPEEAATYELGFRSMLGGGRVRLNGTAFFTDYEDIQVSFQTIDANGQLLTGLGNVASAEISGVEIDLLASPAQGIELNLGIGFNDAKYTDIGPEATGITTGSKFPNTPDTTYTAGAQFEQAVGSSALVYRIDYSWRDDSQLVTPSGDATIIQDAYGLLNARIGFLHGNENWKVALYGTNLTDELIISGASSGPAFESFRYQYARPRQVGFTLTVDF